MAKSESRYPKYEKPVFESKIPPHLLAQLDDKEIWLMENLSRLDQKADWLVEKELDTNNNVRDTDARLQGVETWKSALSGRWAVMSVLGLIAITAVLGAILRVMSDKVFP